jgi:hypothetical protein
MKLKNVVILSAISLLGAFAYANEDKVITAKVCPEAILHPDGSWTPSPTIASVASNGKDVILMENGTWKYSNVSEPEAATKEQPKIVGKPYVVNEMLPSLVQMHHDTGWEPGDYQSAMVFLGWSRDNRYYAFEVHRPASAPHDMDLGSLELQIVDAKTDKWLPQSHLLYVNSLTCEYFDSNCDDLDVRNHKYFSFAGMRKSFQQEKKQKLSKYKIEVGYLTEPVQFIEDGDRYSFPLPDGRNGLLSFQSEEGQQYDIAGYTFSWLSPFNRPIESGKKRQETLSYALNSAFVSPDGSHVAFVVSKYITIHEGTELSFMTNGSPILK